MSKDLTPLKPGQLPVSKLPKFTTTLPFFYLTKKKELLNQTIEYEDLDDEGRPVKWKVVPNTMIGAPAIEAHEIWTRLLRPAINTQKTPDGKLSAIVPLGHLRECLRKVGWKEGGWEAQDLLRALRQIGSAWCVADFWLPTFDVDGNGSTLYRHMRAEFSRMALYAVGNKHVTDEDIKEGKVNFDFDLDDTVYVQLHPVEVEMQRFQLEQPIDNEYLFSVSPSARRWYELLAPKIFGVIKNKGEYCEIRYSWYIKHHPTLKRYYERYRVVFQMKRLTEEHLEFDYIAKIEYRAIKDDKGELDYIIRYYPGERAKESIARILGHIKKERKPAQLQTSPDTPVRVQKPKEAAPKDTRVVALTSRGVAQRVAQQLVAALRSEQPFDEQVEYVDYLISRNPATYKNPAGFYVAFIRDNGEVPPNFETASQKQQREETQAAQNSQEAERQVVVVAHRKYLDEALEDHITKNLSETDYQALIASKKQEILSTNKTAATWEADAFTRFAEPMVRAKLREQIADQLISLEDFAQGRGVKTLALFCELCEGRRLVLQPGSTTLYQYCSCITAT